MKGQLFNQLLVYFNVSTQFVTFDAHKYPALLGRFSYPN